MTEWDELTHLRAQRDWLQRDNTRFEQQARADRAWARSIYRELVRANINQCLALLPHCLPLEDNIFEMNFHQIRAFQARGHRWIGWLTGHLKEIGK